MRIRQLDIPAYGQLVDQQLNDLPSELVLIYGDNESGKSTLFSLLTALLYGFYPIKGFPYRPWHVDRYPEFRAAIALDDGSEVDVYRKLTSSPTSTLQRNGRTENLANRNLPFVQHISRQLYQSLYALTQHNQRALDEKTQQEIEDRLLGSLAANLLRPSRAVIDELEKKASSLWRPDNRGNPEDKKLRDQLHEAKQNLKRIQQINQDVRVDVQNLASTKDKIGKLENTLAKLNARIRRAEVLLPVHDALKQIKAWRSEIPDEQAASQLPDGLENRYQMLSEQARQTRQRAQKLEEEHTQCTQTANGITERDMQLLSVSKQLENWLINISGHKNEHHGIEKLKLEIDRHLEKTKRITKMLLSKPWERTYVPKLQSIILPNLKERIRRFSQLQDEISRMTARAELLPTTSMIGGIPRKILWSLTVLALSSVALSFVLSKPIVPAIASFFCLCTLFVAIFNAFLRNQQNHLKQENKHASRKNAIADQVKTEQDNLREKIKQIFEELPIASSLLEHPDMELYQNIREVQTHLEERDRLTTELQQRQTKWGQDQDNLGQLTSNLGEERANQAGLEQLHTSLEQAREHKRSVDEAQKRIEEIDAGALRDAQQALSKAQQAKNSLITLILAATKEHEIDEQVLRHAKELQDLLRRITNAERDLQNKHPNLKQLKQEVSKLDQSADGWSLLDQQMVEKAKIEANHLQQQLQQLREEKGSLETKIENSKGETSIGEAQGQIEQIEQERTRVQTERDRLALLASLIREADRRFREKHQPDVLKRATRYLGKIVDNYEALTTITDSDGHEQLVVRTASGEFRPVGSPLSGGTLDQVYLAFRLAVIDHLDEGNEKLPLVMDETLINWDNERFDRGVKIIAEIAKTRQVFLFTCHRWLAQRIAKSIPMPLLELSADSQYLTTDHRRSNRSTAANKT